MWLWVGRLLAALASGRKFFAWFALVIPFLTRIVGWVGRLWGAVRKTLLGRLLRMSGILSVAGAVSLALAQAIFKLVSEIVQATPVGSFTWPSNPVIHGMLGAVDTLIPLTLVLDLLVYWVYLWLFCLAIRLGKYIVSLTVG